MFELIAAAFLFLSFQKGGEGCKAMKCQWRGNSLNKAVGFALCPKKTIGGPQSLDSLNFSFFYNLLRREGRFQTRLFLHFSGGAISAASQIQLSARASPSYKIIKDLVRKQMHVSLLPHFVFIDSVYSALSTSSLLIFRQT